MIIRGLLEHTFYAVFLLYLKTIGKFRIIQVKYEFEIGFKAYRYILGIVV